MAPVETRFGHNSSTGPSPAIHFALLMMSKSSMTLVCMAEFIVLVCVKGGAALRGREPGSKELDEVAVIDGFGEVFDALLVAPRVVDEQAALPFAEIDVGVIQVDGVGDAGALRVGKFGVGDEFVFG